MTTCKTSQGEVFCKVSGEGPPIILLHADGSSGTEYDPLVPLLEERFKVIIVDHPGCGRSPRRALSHDYYKESAKAALDVVKLHSSEPAWVVGNGGGAIIGLWMAILKPSRVAGVVADSFVEFFDADDVQRDLAAHQQPSQEMIDFWQEMNGDDWKAVMEQIDRITAQATEQKRSNFNWRLEEVQCPVLITGSKTDHLLSNLAERLLKICAQVTKAQLTIYHDGGHPTMWSQAQAFWRDTLAFIDSHQNSE
jgi:pimeloyl-ACP methyl ester carboxylesterase